MKVFRIERAKYLDITLMGIGASLSSGSRWNSLNTRMVYTAESRSLSMLEISVHLDLSEDLPTDRLYVEIDIPEDLAIHELNFTELPENWDLKPPGLHTKTIGDQFILNKQAAVLKVPSSIVPGEFNFLINPAHTEAFKIVVVSTIPLSFDSRWKHEKEK